MLKKIFVFQTLIFFSLKISAAESEISAFSVYAGYNTQVHCQGRLFVSSVGDPNLVRWEAFPNGLGCGVVLKPNGIPGNTDLLLKTSTGDYHLIIEVKKAPSGLKPKDLEIYFQTPSLKSLKGESE